MQSNNKIDVNRNKLAVDERIQLSLKMLRHSKKNPLSTTQVMNNLIALWQEGDADDLHPEQANLVHDLINLLRSREKEHDYTTLCYDAIELFEGIQIWRRESQVSPNCRRAIEQANSIARVLRDELEGIARQFQQNEEDCSDGMWAAQQAFELALKKMSDEPGAVAQFLDKLGIEALMGAKTVNEIRNRVENLFVSVMKYKEKLIHYASIYPDNTSVLASFQQISIKFQGARFDLDNLALLKNDLKAVVESIETLIEKKHRIEDVLHLDKPNYALKTGLFFQTREKISPDNASAPMLRRSASFS
ncbi:hypothetical protein [Aquicella lusitana]|uniref:Uncharacterized protein n=1 Tax=Aquicella lusitana TaxID=254246 RepID=A0A370GS72_9COXI|nr:hypothetical protein [Aquicella lusitana]RDI44783.1 hypothetical protein C8D86_10835 [Aquicella lusitana]VVC72980.1 hypothetical protein AQULUS_07060 [Aquicella lusitana]